jgi:hypothetical protein
MDDKQSCFLCKKKTFKKDRKLHKMESRDRVKKIAKCAEESNDLSMMKIIESDGFIVLNFKHSTISFTRIRSKTRWMINNLHIGRIYVFETSQFLNHFLKNGIFARNCRVFKVEHNLTDPAEYPYDKQYKNKLNKVQTRSLLPTVTVDINTCFSLPNISHIYSLLK